MNETDTAKIIHAYLGKLFKELEPRLKAMESNIKSLEIGMREVEQKGIQYLGVWQQAQTYNRGDALTYKGGLWIALKETDSKPGTDADFQLAVKSGRP